VPHALFRPLVPAALAGVAALCVLASPAAATDEPPPPPPPSPGGAPAPTVGALGPLVNPLTPLIGAPRPATRRRTHRTGRVGVRVRYRRQHSGSCAGVRVLLSGAGVERVEIWVGGRRIGVDRSRPFRINVAGRRLGAHRRIQLRLVQDGRNRTITRRVRRCS
jgi:hypothetical protein